MRSDGQLKFTRAELRAEQCRVFSFNVKSVTDPSASQELKHRAAMSWRDGDCTYISKVETLQDAC